MLFVVLMLFDEERRLTSAEKEGKKEEDGAVRCFHAIMKQERRSSLSLSFSWLLLLRLVDGISLVDDDVPEENKKSR